METTETVVTKSARGTWRSRLRTLGMDLAFILALLATRGTLADHYYVPSGSMEPTLRVGDHLFVNKAAYGLRLPLSHWWLTHFKPKRGDVVVFEHPRSGIVMVKRLVGLPGDRVWFDGQQLFINGTAVAKSDDHAERESTEFLPGRAHPLYPGANQGASMIEPIVVPADHYYMMGDHRGDSSDSRVWGFVPRDLLLGRAVSILYSGRSGLSWYSRWWIDLMGSEEKFDPRLYR